jgi:hypothetical protein
VIKVRFRDSCIVCVAGYYRRASLCEVLLDWNTSGKHGQDVIRFRDSELFHVHVSQRIVCDCVAARNRLPFTITNRVSVTDCGQEEQIAPQRNRKPSFLLRCGATTPQRIGRRECYHSNMHGPHREPGELYDDKLCRNTCSRVGCTNSPPSPSH